MGLAPVLFWPVAWPVVREARQRWLDGQGGRGPCCQRRWGCRSWAADGRLTGHAPAPMTSVEKQVSGQFSSEIGLAEVRTFGQHLMGSIIRHGRGRHGRQGKEARCR